MKKLGLLCFLLLFLTSCGIKKRRIKRNYRTVTLKTNSKNLPSINTDKHINMLKTKGNPLNANALHYIRKYAPIAVYEMHQHKIPASITLAQGILESASGNSQLAVKANNHFGIKCHTGWKGERVYYTDDKQDECFRKYQYVERSFKDHSLFLAKRKPLFFFVCIQYNKL